MANSSDNYEFATNTQINLSGVAPGPKLVPASIVNAFVLIDEALRCPVEIVLA
ncbi:hypothetical protein N9H39_10850 [Gammaproteobacteria bacterium]|nr:hypothetical protein [Gammaproteobacteria bacterium]